MKVGIITIFDQTNFGNRLQNYAVQECLRGLKIETETLKNYARCNNENYSIIDSIKQTIVFLMKKIQGIIKKKDKRYKNFMQFDKENIKFEKRYITAFNAKKTEKKYDYFVTGSDQVWNPKFGRLTYIDTLGFTSKNKRISLSASFGINNLEKVSNRIKNILSDFKALSVRENQGKKILEDLTQRDDIEVLLDPTMMLTVEQWDKVAKKPINLSSDKYILNYFLGELSESRKAEIERIAKENNCKIINILDKDSEFYQSGPSEFIYLEKNAFLICTDSFHSSVFAILYNRPFIIFEREDKIQSMNSRIETLLEKFKIENRTFREKITNENIKHNYEKAYKILEEERKKFKEFVKRATDM